MNNSLSEDGTVELSEADRIESVDLWKSRLRLVDESVARTFLFMKVFISISVLYHFANRLGLSFGIDYLSAIVSRCE